MADAIIEAQADAIHDLVAAVTNVGLVFDHQPVPKNDWTKFIQTFSTQLVVTPAIPAHGHVPEVPAVMGPRHIRSWTVALLNEARERHAFGGTVGPRKVLRKTSWLIRGFLSWNDEGGTDAEFRGLLGDVANTLDAHVSLNGSCDEHGGVAFALPGDAGGVDLGGVLCHYVEIRLTASKMVTEQTS